MGLINEASVLQRNKNFFNKLKSEIIKNPVIDTYLIRHVSVNVSTVDRDVDTRFFFKVKYNIIDIGLHTLSDKVFVYAKLEPFIQLDTFNVDSRQRDPGHNIPDVVIQKLKENNPYNSMSDTDIMNSKIYKSYTEDLLKVLDARCSLELRSSVYPKFPFRTNAIPLAIYTESTNRIDFPERELSRWESNLTTRKCRRSEDIDNVKRINEISGLANLCKNYTPYRKWTEVKFSVPFEFYSYDW